MSSTSQQAIKPVHGLAAVVRFLVCVEVASGVRVDVVESSEPSPLSPYDGDEAFALLESTIGEAFPDAVVTPYVMMAATDSRHFTRICPRVYRFAPFRMTKAQREAIHSYDERIGLDDLADGVLWYARLIERLR